jgi:amino acid adenylation domain-containing protein
MVVGLLGILKAGGAYVPLEPSYPAERLAQMVEDSAPVALLTHGSMTAALRAALQERCPQMPVLDLEADAERWARASAANPQRAGLTAAHLAYVIYTSGSTGQPKGVMVGHRGVVDRLRWMQETYGFDETDAVLQQTPYTFDVSVCEFFWPLSTGCRLVMARPEEHKDPGYLVQLIRKQRITTLHFVPSMLQLFLAGGEASSCATLRRVICAGEALSGSLIRRCTDSLSGAQMYNLYGPTEASVYVTAWTCRDVGEGRVPIGRPLANTQMYVLDGEDQPVPVGAIGELYIGGVGVARGYQNRPELTAERFVPDPFGSQAGARMYRTGDLARYLPDGNIEYLGRNDFQVKVRGFRIELGEIEAKLRECEGVGEAVVVARQRGAADSVTDVRLVAYYTRARESQSTRESQHAPESQHARGSQRELGAEGLRSHLLSMLPDYMVPSAYVELAALPLSPNGKLDRRALPEPGDDAHVTRRYEEPQGETERRLAAIWSEVLGVERVGRHDNFFELGGHSLLAIRLIERMRRADLHADVRALFLATTLSALAITTKRIKEISL